MDDASDGEDGGAELSGVEDVFVSDEAELPKTAHYGARPSEEEAKLHGVPHLPCQSWRPRCVRGEARRRGRKKKRRESSGVVPFNSVEPR